MNGFLIDEKADGVILSYKAEAGLVDYIKKLNIDIIYSRKVNVDQRVADHPDLQIHPLDLETFVASKDSYAYYKERLEPYGLKVLEAKTYLDKTYPKDCSLNVGRVKKYYLTNDKAIDSSLERELKARGLEAIYVKQAYAKCSTIPINDFIITSDIKIHRSLAKKQIKSYLIGYGHISLDGFDSGIIGGTCGMINQSQILFTGNIEKYKYYKELMNILEIEEIEALYPKDVDLVDLGSIIPLVYKKKEER